MPTLYSRTFRWAKAEWYHLWVKHFADLYALEYSIRKVWGQTPGGAEQVKADIRQDYLLEVTFIGLLNRDDATLIESVRRVLQAPPPTPKSTALEVVDHIIQEPT